MKSVLIYERPDIDFLSNFLSDFGGKRNKLSRNYEKFYVAN
jgi:hypothetical protein